MSLLQLLGTIVLGLATLLPGPQTPASTVTPENYCGCEDQPQLDVLAVVNGVKIKKQDLTVDTRSKVRLLQDTVVDARSQELNKLINEKLIDGAAAKRGITPTRLFQIEVKDKAGPPTESDARDFYNKNKVRIPKDFSDVKQELLVALKDDREKQQARIFINNLRVGADVKLLVEIDLPPNNEADRARVLAMVNGSPITSNDVEESLTSLIYEVQQQVYTYRKNDLDLKINDMLLDQEAKRQGIMPVTLVDKEVRTKIPIITDQQALAYYNENKSRMRDDFPKLKFQIIQILISQEQDKLAHAFADQLRAKAALQIFLTAPEAPTFKIAIDDQPMRGNPNATVTVVQFTDYECPSCAQHYSIVEKLISEFGGEVRFVNRDYPLTQHHFAVKAAEAAEAAHQQGKYWEYIALLYRNQRALQVEKLKLYASELGLDQAKFDAALDSGLLNDQIERDILDGDRCGVDGTPSFFINGKPIADTSYQGLKIAIQRALKKS